MKSKWHPALVSTGAGASAGAPREGLTWEWTCPICRLRAEMRQHVERVKQLVSPDLVHGDGL